MSKRTRSRTTREIHYAVSLLRDSSNWLFEEETKKIVEDTLQQEMTEYGVYRS